MQVINCRTKQSISLLYVLLEDCVTPNGNYGKSVPLQNCSHLESNRQSTDTKQKKFLLESRINKTHVCCNKGENNYKSVPPAPVSKYYYWL